MIRCLHPCKCKFRDDVNSLRGEGGAGPPEVVSSFDAMMPRLGQEQRGNLMMRAILAGGGVALIGVFIGAVYFASAGGPTSSGQMTSNEAVTAGLFALLAAIGSLFFAFARFAPASSWLATIAGWIVGFHVFPPILIAAAVMFISITR